MLTKILKLMTVLLVSICPGMADELPFRLPQPTPNTQIFDHSHSLWSAVLREYVVMRGPQSRVQYAKIKAHRETMQAYINVVGSLAESEFTKFTEPQKIAFLINAYNAYTVALITKNYPIASIKGIGGWFASPWKIEFLTLRGDVHSLDDIEHTMLRKEFNEPRIHFALVCAAVSCPALRNEAYVAERLDSQLDAAADRFLSDPERNRFDLQSRTLYLSSIFKWYADDFNPKFGTSTVFAATVFVIARMKRLGLVPNDLIASAISTEFLPYDWSLNEQN